MRNKLRFLCVFILALSSCSETAQEDMDLGNQKKRDYFW
jgi:hypothetical protein